MKHIKPYRIFESQESRHPGFPDTEEEIHKICNEYKIENYTINDDLSIDVDEDVNLRGFDLTHLPLNFNYVRSDFNCYYNKLETLQGAPKTVDGYFNCSNNKLTSLKSAPDRVGGGFSCSVNQIKSLEGVSDKIGGNFNCHGNKLKTLKGAPHIVDGYFNCQDNKLITLIGIPNISSDIYCDYNPIYTLINKFIRNDNVRYLLNEFNHYRITDGKIVYKERLEMFCSDFDLEMPNMYGIMKHYKIV